MLSSSWSAIGSPRERSTTRTPALLYPHHVVAFTLLALAACAEPPPLYPPSAPSDIQAACALTERRCSECHDRDRIVAAHKTHEEWNATVEKMRQMPGSTIRPDETEVILRCLYYRNDMSFLDAPGPWIAAER